jgi:hypothetical protein
VVIIVSREASQFCAPEVRLPDRVRRVAVLRPAPVVAALDFLAEVVFDLATDRALAGNFIVLVAPLEAPVALGCARVLAVDEAPDPRRDRAGDCSADLRLVRDGVF